MDAFSKHELQSLIGNQLPPCISLYMPMHRTMPDAQQNPIRFRNLIHEAERRLHTNGGAPNLNDMMKQARNLLNETDFWLHPADGLAAFVSPDQFHSFRLPLRFDEMLIISKQFHTMPLLPLLTGDTRFYLLALSQNDVRAFECDRHACKQIEIENLPHSRKEALKEQTEKQLQVHTTGMAIHGSPNAGERVGMFHGHGSSTDESKDFQLRFCREVDRALHPKIKHDTAPLVVAAVDYLHPIYKDVNSYAHLLEQGVSGNPELWNQEDIHHQAWSVVEPHFMKGRAAAEGRYEEMKGTNRVSNDLRTIVTAAYYGRVDTLFVTVGVQQQWGKFDLATGAVDVHDQAQPDDVELLDAAAAQTLLNNGTVYADAQAAVPDQGLMAAIFRY